MHFDWFTKCNVLTDILLEWQLRSRAESNFDMIELSLLVTFDCCHFECCIPDPKKRLVGLNGIYAPSMDSKSGWMVIHNHRVNYVIYTCK
jgi:hypothetical protein